MGCTGVGGDGVLDGDDGSENKDYIELVCGPRSREMVEECSDTNGFWMENSEKRRIFDVFMIEF